MHRIRMRFFLSRKKLFFISAFFIVIFLVYQLLSVRQLGKEFSKRRPRLQTNFRSYEKADGMMKSAIDKIEESHQIPSHITKDRAFVFGVLPINQKLYSPSVDNKFKCLRTGEIIDFAFVNDDFCDCSDFSDEPSTGACNDGRFYCTHQSAGKLYSIASYKVNDGICDCCDGSDEWAKILLPQHTQVPANKQKGVHQTPCQNHCSS